MKNLKNALGKEESDLSGVKYSESVRTYKNNDSQSMWSIGLASEEQEEGKGMHSNPVVISQIIEEITQMQKQGKIADQAVFSGLHKSYLQRNTDHPQSEKDSIESMEKLLSQVLIHSPPSNETFTARLLEIAKNKRRKLKNKGKTGAMEFDEIAGKLFKKTGERGAKQNKRKILQVNLSPQILKKSARKSNKKHDSKNSGSGSHDSGDGKLGKLLSSDRYDLKKSQKINNDKKQETAEEGYSFSAVMSASVAVKQRQPRNTKNEKQKANLTNARQQKDGLDQDNDKQDAFIFFRPKKNRR